MSLHNQQHFTAAIELVRNRGVDVQEARAKGGAAWREAMGKLMQAKAALDGIILRGLTLDPPGEPQPRDAWGQMMHAPTGDEVPVEIVAPSDDDYTMPEPNAHDVETAPRAKVEPEAAPLEHTGQHYGNAGSNAPIISDCPACQADIQRLDAERAAEPS